MSDTQSLEPLAFSGSSFLAAEYQTLRAELASRTKTQNLLIFLTFASFLALATFAAGSLLLYPPLALYLALLWLAQERVIKAIGRYIEEKIEPALAADGAGWQKYRRALPRAEHALPLVFSSRGIFAGTQIIALAVSALNFISGLFSPSYTIAVFAFGAFWLAQVVVFAAGVWATKLTYEFTLANDGGKPVPPMVKLDEQKPDA